MDASSDEQMASYLHVVGAALGCFLPLYFFLWRTRRNSDDSLANSCLPLPPGTFGFLSVGETFQFFNALRLGDPIGFMRERSAKFRSKTFKTRLFFHKTAVLQGVAANRFMAAASNKQQLIGSLPAASIAVLGKHIPPAKQGAPHRRLRQIMASCLGPLALRKQVGRVDHITQLHFETLCTAAHVQSQVLLLSLIKENNFRIACSLLAGTEDEALVARMYKHYKIWSAGVVSLPVDFPGTAYRRAKCAKQMLVYEVGKLMDSKAQQGHSGDSNENLLCMLMRARDENGGCLDREELQDVIHFLLLGGCDSSTATLSFVLKCLEQNPACYHRLLQEHEAIASQKNPGERLTWTDIQDMKYTWAVIQETIRIRPVAFGVLREATTDLNFDGYRIPRGWKVAFDMTSTHDDQHFFQEPHKFYPSRFDFEKLQARNGPPPYTFIPFGLGPHACPGGDFARMVMSTYLHHLALSKIRWTSIDPNEKVHMLATLSLVKSYPAKLFIDK